MAAITVKCPTCGGELVFDPAAQEYLCAYCQSRFTQAQIDRMAPAAASEQAAYQEETEGTDLGTDGSSGAVLYSCPSCGAQVITDETTAATFCYYCHNPVVLEGRLSGAYLPGEYRAERRN